VFLQTPPKKTKIKNQRNPKNMLKKNKTMFFVNTPEKKKHVNLKEQIMLFC
jgi:hypothetical protein